MRIAGLRGVAFVLAVLAAVGAAPARAEGIGGRPLGFLLRLGLDFGGDELAKAEYTDGDTQSVTAGGLASFSTGVLYHPAAPYAVEATIGYKVDNANADNGKIEFARYPVDLIVSYAHGGHRLGAGGTVHLSPKFTCQVDGICDGSVSFDTAFGGIVQYAYGWGRDHGFELGVRGTFIKYRRAGISDVDGSSFGMILGFWL